MTKTTLFFATMLTFGVWLGSSTDLAASTFANIRFEQLASNAPYQGRRNEIIVSGPGRPLNEKVLTLRAPFRTLLKDEYPLKWSTLPPDTDIFISERRADEDAFG